MRVMFVCTTGGHGRRQLGGAERFLAEMLPALAARGLDVVACTPDDSVAAALRTAGVRWIDLGATRRIDPAYVRGIAAQARALRPDVVSAHLLSAAMHTRAALGVRGRRIPLVVTLHSSLRQHRDAATTRSARTAARVNIALDRALRHIRPHTSVAVSGFEAAELRGRGRPARVRVIDNALPASWPTANGAGARGDSGRVRVGYLGRLEPDKGVDLLPDVASALPEVDFVVAGSGAAAPPELPNLRSVGRVDAASFLSGLDCLLVPSRVEAFGRSALEAMSLGVPVVHTGVGGLAELTRRGDGCLSYRAEPTPASLAAAIRLATSGPGAAERRSATARWYAERYSFTACVDGWLALLREVAHDRG